MASNREAVLMKVGLDTAGMTEGTLRMQSQQRAAAREYVALWESALAKRDAAETSAEVKQATRNNLAVKLWREREAARAKATAEAQSVINAEIAGGSVPASMAGGAVGRAEGKALSTGEKEILIAGGTIGSGYAFDKSGKLLGKIGADGKLEKKAEEAVKGLEALGKSGQSSATEVRHATTLIREASQGHFMRMIGSASRFAWKPIAWAGRGLEKIPGLRSVIPGVDIAGSVMDVALIGRTVREGFQWRAAAKERDASSKDEAGAYKESAEFLKRRIEMMQSAGILDKAAVASYMGTLSRGKPEDILAILTSTNRLMPGGGIDKLANIPEEKRLEKELADHQAENARKQMTASQRFLDDSYRQVTIKNKIAMLDKDSADYMVNLLNLQNQLNEAVEQGNEDKKKMLEDAENEKKKKQKEINEEKIKGFELQKSEIEQSEQQQKDDLKLPSIEEFANGSGYYAIEGRGRSRKRVRHTFTDDLAKRYGAGGIYDLTNGPLAADARDYLRGQYQMTYDYEDFNAETGKGYQDFLASEQGKSDTDYLSKLRAPLATAGVLSQAELLKSIDVSINQLRTTLDGLPVTVASN